MMRSTCLPRTSLKSVGPKPILKGRRLGTRSQKGKSTEEDIRRNARVDHLAKEEAKVMAVPEKYIKLAEDRAALTILVQKMPVAQWHQLLDESGVLANDLVAECPDAMRMEGRRKPNRFH